ncbi:MAG: hypothetical protein WCE75_14215 [Terracidiphilus sp.]
MTPIEEMTDQQLDRYALAVLAKELGPLGMARYLRMHGMTTGDYTRDRHLWLDRLTIEEIIDKARSIEIPSPE